MLYRLYFIIFNHSTTGLKETYIQLVLPKRFRYCSLLMYQRTEKLLNENFILNLNTKQVDPGPKTDQ